MTGAWIQSGNYIQFKVKPVSSSDKITVSVAKNSDAPSVALAQTVFSSTDSIAKPVMDSNGYYCQTPLMRAYNQAFIERSEFADGWYQVSVPAPAKGNKLIITLDSESIPAGSKIYMDDLTVQFASTYKSIKFSSSNAIATGACLVTD
jgi:hypothetical protein